MQVRTKLVASGLVILLTPLVAGAFFFARDASARFDPWAFIRPARPVRDLSSQAELIRDLETFIPVAMERHRIVGLAMALVRGREVVWERGFGWADRENRVAMTPDVRFHAASLANLASAIGLLRLVDAGHVGLDAPVRDYLRSARIENPYRTDGGGTVTVRHLLDHSSGLGLGYAGWSLPVGPRAKRVSDVIDRAVPFRLAYRPGRSNSIVSAITGGRSGRYPSVDGFLQALLVEDVTAEPWAEAQRRAVFSPLGMESTAYDPPDASSGSLKTYLADGELLDEPDLPAVLPEDHARNALSLHTTVADYARLVSVLASGGLAPDGSRFLEPSTMDELFAPSARVNVIVEMGLGMIVNAKPELLRVWFPGRSQVLAAFCCYPNDGVCAVVMMNRAERPGPLSEILLRALEGA